MGSQFFAINNINRQNASKGRPQRDQGDPPQSHWRRSRCIVRPCSQDRSAGFVAKEGWRRYRKSNWRLERTPCHRQAHHPKPSSRGFRRPLCLVSRHQGLEGTPRDRKKEKNIKHSKSITLDEVIEIARTMRFKSLSKELKGGVKEILGTAFSVGCQVDGRSPKDVSDDIESGEIEIPDEWMVDGFLCAYSGLHTSQ